MKLYLVRHGQSGENSGIFTGEAPRLTTEGIEQAKRLGMFFKGLKLDSIYCSNLERAKDTLNEIKPYVKGVKIKFTDDVREMDDGIYKNTDYSDYRKVRKEFKDKTGKSSRDFRPEGGENYFDCEKRAYEFLEYLKKTQKGKNILVVSHAKFLSLLILRVFKLPMRENVYWKLHNASVSCFEFDEGFNVKKFYLDDFKHLVENSSFERRVVEKWTEPGDYAKDIKS